MRHLPELEVRYTISAKWICDGLEHEHLSEAAASKCEANPRASRYGRRRDGSYA